MVTSVTIGLPHGGKTFKLIHGPDVSLHKQKQEFKALLIRGSSAIFCEVQIRQDGSRSRKVALEKTETRPEKE